MEHGGSMPYSQGLSNNSYPEPNQPNYPHWYLSLQYYYRKKLATSLKIVNYSSVDLGVILNC